MHGLSRITNNICVCALCNNLRTVKGAAPCYIYFLPQRYWSKRNFCVCSFHKTSVEVHISTMSFENFGLVFSLWSEAGTHFFHIWPEDTNHFNSRIYMENRKPETILNVQENFCSFCGFEIASIYCIDAVVLWLAHVYPWDNSICIHNFGFFCIWICGIVC